MKDEKFGCLAEPVGQATPVDNGHNDMYADALLDDYDPEDYGAQLYNPPNGMFPGGRGGYNMGNYRMGYKPNRPKNPNPKPV